VQAPVGHTPDQAVQNRLLPLPPRGIHHQQRQTGLSGHPGDKHPGVKELQKRHLHQATPAAKVARKKILRHPEHREEQEINTFEHCAGIAKGPGFFMPLNGVSADQ
jgi:hypothetical protein